MGFGRIRDAIFFRSQLIWIYTICKGRVYLGSAGQGLIDLPDRVASTTQLFADNGLLYQQSKSEEDQHILQEDS